MKGVEPHEAGWFTRLVYWFVKREVNKLTGRPGFSNRSRSPPITRDS
jgi:hypothetical protein